MKNKMLTVVMLFVVLAGVCFAESFNSVYKKNLTARGGADAVKAAKSFIMEGELIREDSIKFNFRVAYKMPKSMVVEYYQAGDTSALGFNGKSAWTIMPSLSQSVIELPATAAEEAMNLTVKPIIDYYNRLDYYKKINAKVTVTEGDSLNEIPQYRLFCPGENGAAEVILVNKTDDLISQINSAFKVGGANVPAVIRVDNYMTDGDVTMPHHIKIINGDNSIVELNISLMEVNPVLDDIIFEIPK
ncbi:MAG: hypothetical protein PHV24_01910 [Candidatus Kapabacteria bacterium]|nr:hypothetical protein [Candidatus Kapabacteria bacterium]